MVMYGTSLSVLCPLSSVPHVHGASRSETLCSPILSLLRSLELPVTQGSEMMECGR